MNTSASEITMPVAITVKVTTNTLTVELSDGRKISAPTAWYPRLSHGTAQERNNWRLIGRGSGLHWKDLDEDIGVESLLTGHASGESQASLKKWLARCRLTRR